MRRHFLTSGSIYQALDTAATPRVTMDCAARLLRADLKPPKPSNTPHRLNILLVHILTHKLSDHSNPDTLPTSDANFEHHLMQSFVPLDPYLPAHSLGEFGKDFAG